MVDLLVDLLIQRPPCARMSAGMAASVGSTTWVTRRATATTATRRAIAHWTNAEVKLHFHLANAKTNFFFGLVAVECEH